MTLPPIANHTVHNERTKLLANALDRASTACFAVGTLAPWVTVDATAGASRLIGLGISTAFWFTSAVLLHLTARHLLGRLRP